MKKNKQARNEIKWLKKPEPHNYPAAHSYLSLIYPEAIASTFVAKLKKAPVTNFKAKDIFRASRLSLLGVSNAHVEKDRKKIKKGIALSPILLVRDTAEGTVIIADGYHRMCGVYAFDEDAVMPCKIV
ncbi:MAG TPA: hypothetical protein VNZ49_03935 [Bacteroidia bacterium]|jgi:hypothetical protein|nr:hypothetical protein [Bacteroidia bacterium]